MNESAQKESSAPKSAPLHTPKSSPVDLSMQNEHCVKLNHTHNKFRREPTLIKKLGLARMKTRRFPQQRSTIYNFSRSPTMIKVDATGELCPDRAQKILFLERTIEETKVMGKQLLAILMCYLLWVHGRITNSRSLNVPKSYLLIKSQAAQSWFLENLPILGAGCYPRLADDLNSELTVNCLVFISLYWLWDVLWDSLILRTEPRSYFDEADVPQNVFYSFFNMYWGLSRLLECLYNILMSEATRHWDHDWSAVYWIGANILSKVVYDLTRGPLKGYMFTHHTGQLTVVTLMYCLSSGEASAVDEQLLMGAGGETFVTTPTKFLLISLGKYGFIPKSYRAYSSFVMMFLCVMETPIAFLVFFHFSRRFIQMSPSGVTLTFTPLTLISWLTSCYLVYNRVKIVSIYITRYIQARAEHEKTKNLKHTRKSLQPQARASTLPVPLRPLGDHDTKSILRDRSKLRRSATLGGHEVYNLPRLKY